MITYETFPNLDYCELYVDTSASSPLIRYTSAISNKSCEQPEQDKFESMEAESHYLLSPKYQTHVTSLVDDMSSFMNIDCQELKTYFIELVIILLDNNTTPGKIDEKIDEAKERLKKCSAFFYFNTEYHLCDIIIETLLTEFYPIDSEKSFRKIYNHVLPRICNNEDFINTYWERHVKSVIDQDNIDLRRHGGYTRFTYLEEMQTFLKDSLPRKAYKKKDLDWITFLDKLNKNFSLPRSLSKFTYTLEMQEKFRKTYPLNNDAISEIFDPYQCSKTYIISSFENYIIACLYAFMDYKEKYVLQYDYQNRRYHFCISSREIKKKNSNEDKIRQEHTLIQNRRDSYCHNLQDEKCFIDYNDFIKFHAEQKKWALNNGITFLEYCKYTESIFYTFKDRKFAQYVSLKEYHQGFRRRIPCQMNEFVTVTKLTDSCETDDLYFSIVQLER